MTGSTIDGTDVITIEHGRANALDLSLVDALRDALDRAASERSRGALVLTGSGSIFCAGVDLFRVVEGGREYIERFLPALSDLFLRLFLIPRPVVAAINGHAIAGGCILACACDYRVMSGGAGTIGLPELAVGVPFPASAVELLRHAVGSPRLQELLYFGRTYGPADALAHALVDEVAPAERVMPRAVDAGRELASRPPESFRLTKQHLRAPAAERIRSAERETPALIDAWASPETLDAVRVYLERTLRKEAPRRS
ncbi:MAG TPA: enoyl-CoA hydratase/isomerase family protein [Vicinamibacterales bacterium]|nr:enoyl-CoA hydratase/isomerase family protein [Vicinamibacterales bacterium]